MQFPLTAWVANIHRHQLLAEAEKSRRYSRLRTMSSRPWGRPLACIGKALIFAGLWLRARNEPTICSSPKVCRRGC
jgi:hypothetical protein